ncbi:MAG: HlyC/CorC family transporter [Planctomycetes bacterium]|nr:HlyC/CorC family transporter [Planctomycetota bacterium]
MVMLVVYVLIALVVSTLCSLAEAVLLSITPSYIAQLQQENSPHAARLKQLKLEVDKPLATILTLNTVAHTIGAAGAGAQAELAFGSGSLGIVSAVLTVLILLVSEIIPKSLGAAHWKTLAPAIGRILGVLSKILGPVIWLELAITKIFTTTGVHGAAGVSRAEISAIAQLGADQGALEESESRILKNMFRFGSLTARDVMTPRTVLYALPEDTPVSELADRETIRFSRIPIYRGTIDTITGYVFVNELLLAANHGGRDRPLSEFNREIKLIAEGARLLKVFDTLLAAKRPVALVVDEFGGTAGLVTLEDLVETLLGLEIVDEADAVHDMQELARQQWRRRAFRLGLIEDESQEPLASQILKAEDVKLPAATGEGSDAASSGDAE